MFEDQITLDNMSRAQLKAINRLLMLPTIGTNNYFRFRLRMKLRELRADDLVSCCSCNFYVHVRMILQGSKKNASKETQKRNTQENRYTNNKYFNTLTSYTSQNLSFFRVTDSRF